MAYTKFNKVIHLKYAGMVASHHYIRKKDQKSVEAIGDNDPFVSPWGPKYSTCNTKWKMSKDKKEIYAICPHKIKFVLDERR